MNKITKKFINTQKPNCTQVHKLLSLLLLFSFPLQGCYSSLSEHNLKKEINDQKQGYERYENSTKLLESSKRVLLSNQRIDCKDRIEATKQAVYKTREGYSVSFGRNSRSRYAYVQYFPSEEFRYDKRLPIIFKKQQALQNVTYENSKWTLNIIKKLNKEFLYVGRMGLLGGSGKGEEYDHDLEMRTRELYFSLYPNERVNLEEDFEEGEGNFFYNGDEDINEDDMYECVPPDFDDDMEEMNEFDAENYVEQCEEEYREQKEREREERERIEKEKEEEMQERFEDEENEMQEKFEEEKEGRESRMEQEDIDMQDLHNEEQSAIERLFEKDKKKFDSVLKEEGLGREERFREDSIFEDMKAETLVDKVGDWLGVKNFKKEYEKEILEDYKRSEYDFNKDFAQDLKNLDDAYKASLAGLKEIREGFCNNHREQSILRQNEYESRINKEEAYDKELREIAREYNNLYIEAKEKLSQLEYANRETRRVNRYERSKKKQAEEFYDREKRFEDDHKARLNKLSALENNINRNYLDRKSKMEKRFASEKRDLQSRMKDERERLNDLCDEITQILDERNEAAWEKEQQEDQAREKERQRQEEEGKNQEEENRKRDEENRRIQEYMERLREEQEEEERRDAERERKRDEQREERDNRRREERAAERERERREEMEQDAREEEEQRKKLKERDKALKADAEKRRKQSLADLSKLSYKELETQLGHMEFLLSDGEIDSKEVLKAINEDIDRIQEQMRRLAKSEKPTAQEDNPTDKPKKKDPSLPKKVGSMPGCTLMDPKKIEEAAYEAVQEVIEHPSYGMQQAACNVGVGLHFEKLTGNKSLRSKNYPEDHFMDSNEMYNHFLTSKDWKEIHGPAGLQNLANEGYFIAGSWYEPQIDPTGHVFSIIRGEEEYSGSWECMVPRTMDSGAKNRWPTKTEKAKSLAYSLGKDKKAGAKYFIYTGEIK